MNLLTWHGAVLRVDHERQRLVQDPLWMTERDGDDFDLDSTHPALPDGTFLRTEPGGRAGTCRLRHNGGYLSAPPSRREPGFEPDEALDWQNFLLISPTDLADLRHILAHRWRAQPSGAWLEKSEIRLVPGFGLAMGAEVIDLPATLPLPSSARVTMAGEPYEPPPCFTLPGGDAGAHAIELPDALPARSASQAAEGAGLRVMQASLGPASPTPVRTAGVETHNVDGFLLAADGRLTLAEAARYAPPPLTLHGADTALFARYLASAGAAAIGWVPQNCVLRHRRDCTVSLARGQEGAVQDPTGSAAATRLEGPLLVFYDRNLNGQAAWLTGAMPALEAMSRLAPRSTRLLLPAHAKQGGRDAPLDVKFEHREVMAALGYGHLPTLVSEAAQVRAASVIYMDPPAPAALGPVQLRAVRDRALRPFDGPGEAVRRIYIDGGAAEGSVQQPELARFLSEHGFERVRLDMISFPATIQLFREASFVVGPSGGGLSNILFAPPGLRVLELMDERAFEPGNWMLAGKLGHVHGFLGCPGGRFLMPDMERFQAVFFALEAYRA